MASSMAKSCLAMARSGMPTGRIGVQLRARAQLHSALALPSWATRQDSKALLAVGIAGAAVTAAAARPGGSANCEQPSANDFDTISLKDGRTLAYKVHGSGVPIFALHGMESCRETFDTSIWGSPPQPLQTLFSGVQVIAIDRPGYGDSSDPPQGYSYLTFVNDLVELADKLSLQKFCVAGHSSGGPYALAASAMLPDRVVACAAISSDAPYVHPKATAEFAKTGADMDAAPLIRSGYFGGSKSDRHPWKQGCLGWVCDYTLERIPYPFSLEAITLGERLTVWVGTEDPKCISLGAKFLHELIPGSLLREQPRGHGLKKNLSGVVEYRYFAEIYAELETRFIARS